MKKSFIVLTALVAMTFVGCKEAPYINAPGNNEMTKNDTLPVIALPDPVDMEGFTIPEGCLSVYQAIDTCKTLASGATTTAKYYVKGWVRSFDSKHESGMESYGNGTFYIAATNDGHSDTKMFEAYQVYGKNGKKFTNLNQIEIGDFVIIYGQLTNYNDTYETVGKGAAYVYDSSNPNFDPKQDPTKVTPDPEGADVPEGTLNVYEAIDLCDSIGSGNTTNKEYYVKGWVRKFDSKHESGMQQYGNGTFYIAPTNDGETDGITFEAYQVYGKDGKQFTSLDQVAIGDFVVIKGKLSNYNGTAETVGKGAAYVYYSTNELWDTTIDPEKITPDPEGADVPEGTLNVYEAVHICDSIGAGKTTTGEYYVKGWVRRLDNKHESGVQQYGNGTFYIAATNDGTTDGITFEAYQVYGKNKQRLTDPKQVKVGDFVVLRGKLTNYNGTAETVGKGAAYIYYSTNPLW